MHSNFQDPNGAVENRGQRPRFLLATEDLANIDATKNHV